jgi:hypothetical protein
MQRGTSLATGKSRQNTEVVRKQTLFEGPGKVPFQQKKLFVLGENPLSMFQRMEEQHPQPVL